MSEFQPVHAAGHVDVCEHQNDVLARFQNGESFIGIAGLDRHEDGFLDDVNSQQVLKFVSSTIRMAGGGSLPSCRSRLSYEKFLAGIWGRPLKQPWRARPVPSEENVIANWDRERRPPIACSLPRGAGIPERIFAIFLGRAWRTPRG